MTSQTHGRHYVNNPPVPIVKRPGQYVRQADVIPPSIQSVVVISNADASSCGLGVLDTGTPRSLIKIADNQWQLDYTDDGSFNARLFVEASEDGSTLLVDRYADDGAGGWLFAAQVNFLTWTPPLPFTSPTTAWGNVLCALGGDVTIQLA